MPESATKLIHFDPENIIEFNAPYNRPKTVVLKMKNICDKTITFKIKTTAPYSYNVSPTNGYIHSNSIVSVKIIFVGNREQIGASKHKFLIQAAIQTKNVENIFNEIVPYEHKIKCLFLDNVSSKSSLQLNDCKEDQHVNRVENINLNTKIKRIDNSEADKNDDDKLNKTNESDELMNIKDKMANENVDEKLNKCDNMTIFYVFWFLACILLCIGIVALKMYKI